MAAAEIASYYLKRHHLVYYAFVLLSVRAYPSAIALVVPKVPPEEEINIVVILRNTIQKSFIL